ncbi:prephenate dehydratase [Spirosoma montaniterrae]|uniref:Bifunctional chorismate mutase/prephenate dehydratase n=1 Tax=Spirosoma montaniterrae TaxID=1178516 RepID=A0A1P9WW89_9BACT|nr:prephenate dehydratase [Spirosoma montaniterrae]AQG79652.1 chloride transporter [Spirosoma montaniterrae]
MNLESLRNEIDALDDHLLTLLNQRMELVRKVGELKRTTNAVIYRPEREKQILDRLHGQNDGLLNRQAIEAIFLEIFAVSRNLELPERVAYLGPEGSFTHQAAESRFGAMSAYTALPTIRSVFESVETGRARFGVVPIENNQEGIVSEAIDLLLEKDLTIAAEAQIPVHFTFATQTENLADITHIYSKDIAFRQCSKFLNDTFDGLKAELVPVESTSKAAKLAGQQPHTAAICSGIAAKLFDVPVLFDNIEDSDLNRTRFLILAKEFVNQPSGYDKTTLIARLPNTEKPGVLAEFLQEFNARSINLTKIESRPLREGATFRYWFLLECEGHANDPDLQEVLNHHAADVKLLGSYVRMA